jgi:hypothetical protein
MVPPMPIPPPHVTPPMRRATPSSLGAAPQRRGRGAPQPMQPGVPL